MVDFAGFKGGGRDKQNRQTLREFLDLPTVKRLFATEETADIFGTVKDGLRRQGTPLPINDVWIASHALETGSVLVTYDMHFNRVQGLRCWPGQQSREL